MIITAGKYKGRKISVPDENITRPTLSKVRMSIFNTLQSLINFEEKSFLDMFGGSGIMGLEALSRGFLKAVEIEKNIHAFKIIKNNFKSLNVQNCEIIYGDSLKILQKSDKKFDVIYIDPPYFSEIYENCLQTAEKISKGIVILEHVIDLDFSDYNLIKQKKYGDKYISFIGF